jgi:hypothetical protein
VKGIVVFGYLGIWVFGYLGIQVFIFWRAGNRLKFYLRGYPLVHGTASIPARQLLIVNY